MSLSNEHKAALHARARELGLDREAYESVLWGAAGVTSSLDLDSAGFYRVMKRFDELDPQKARKRRRGGSKKYEDLRRRPFMATPAQLRYMEWLWAQISEYEACKRREIIASASRAVGFRRWLKREFHIDDLRWMDLEQAVTCINRLKGMCASRGLSIGGE